MKQALMLRRGALTTVLFFVALCGGGGCDYFNLSGSDSEKMAPSASAGSSDSASTPATGNDQAGSSNSSTSTQTPAATPDPAPVPQTEFAWIPGADSVVVKIPAKYAHWKFVIVSRRKHVMLFGPDYRGGNKIQEVIYTLEGGGAAWRQKSRDAGDDGTVMVFVNTKEVPPGGDARNAAWRIMNPTAAQYGDGDRLMPGQGNR